MKEHTQRQEADGEKGGAQHLGTSLRRALQLIRPLRNIFIRSLGNMFIRSLGNMKSSDHLRVFISFVEAIYMVCKNLKMSVDKFIGRQVRGFLKIGSF